MRRRGIFITFEGVEGSGKTTQIRRLARRLRKEGIPPVVTREPGGTALGDALRRPLLDPASAGMPPLTELLLYAAARADHIHRVIQPALERGRVVLCDRYLDATLAYQGYGRGLPLDLIRRIHSVPPLGLRPDLTLLLEIDVEKGLRRARRRDEALRSSGEGRFEAESLEFHRRVAAGYRRLTLSRRGYRRIDASGPIGEVAEKIARFVLPLAGAIRTERGSRKTAGEHSRIHRSVVARTPRSGARGGAGVGRRAVARRGGR